jgi:type I restriction enzyme S subunit
MSDVLIPDGWTQVKLGDVCEVVMGQSPPGDTVERFPTGKPLLNGPTEFTDRSPIPAQWTKRITKVAPQGSLLFCVRGSTTGKMNWADQEYVIGRGIGAIWHKSQGSLAPIVRAWIEYQLPHLLNIATGSTFPNVSRDQLTNLSLLLPPLHEQKAIAHILGSLDDKIYQLRKTNSVLEDMASALFKSWFVDFDPVKAKQENIPTGLPPEIDALFPDSFEDSSLGPIPKGWRVGCVGDVCELSKDSVNPGKHPDEVFAHYSLPAFDEGQQPKLEAGSVIMSNKYLVPSDAVLLSKLNPHIPRIWMPDVANNNRPIASTEYLVLSPKPGYSRGYVFALVTSSAFTSIYGTLVSGTTGSHQRVTPSHVLEVSLVLPLDEVLNEYAELVMDLYSKNHSNIHQITTLTNLRDTLLPKLISGELRVPEAEQMVAELGL